MSRKRAEPLPEVVMPDAGELPEEWNTAPLLELSELIRGVSYKKGEEIKENKNGYLPLLRANNISQEINFENLLYVPEKFVKEKQYIRQGDVLFAMSSGSKSVVGKAATINKQWEGTFGAFCGVLRPSKNVDWKFFGYFFQTRYYRDMISEASAGVNINNLKREYFEAINFPLPPLDEQQRIVARIEALLAHVNGAHERLNRVPLVMKRFRQGVLEAACSGRLTEDWRGKHLGIKPAFDELFELCEKRKNVRRMHFEKTPKTPPEVIDVDGLEIPDIWYLTNIGFLGFVTKLAGFEYTKYINLTDSGEIPVIRAQNVQMGKFVNTNIKFISKDTSNILERSQVKANDILIVYVGAGVGNVCLAPSEGRWHLSSNVGKIELDWMSNGYLLLYLQSSFGINKILSVSKATAQPSLSMQAIRDTIVYVPPLAEQHEIVRRVNALFARADAVEREIETATKRAEALTQVILAKAFRGELVQHEAEVGKV